MAVVYPVKFYKNYKNIVFIFAFVGVFKVNNKFIIKGNKQVRYLKDEGIGNLLKFERKFPANVEYF